METLLWLLFIGGVLYTLFEHFIYKRTKNYKEKQILKLVQEADDMLSNTDPDLQNTQALLDNLISRDEQVKFSNKILMMDDNAISKMLNKLLLPKEDNMTNETIAQRIFLLLYRFKNTKLKYVRLMKRLEHDSIDEKLKVTKDWCEYVRIFVNAKTTDNFPLAMISFEEIERRIDKKLAVLH